MTYSATKFEVATSNGLEGDTFTSNVTDGRQTDFGTKLIYPFFTCVALAKAGLVVAKLCQSGRPSETL